MYVIIPMMSSGEKTEPDLESAPYLRGLIQACPPYAVGGVCLTPICCGFTLQ